jgi:hypothetical protein
MPAWRSAGVLALAVSACETATVAPPREPITRLPAPAAPDLTSGARRDFASKRFDLRLPLPDGLGWSIDDRRTPWLTATHAASSSTLMVRVWREDDLVNRARCEERARSWANLPQVDGAQIIEQRAVPLPAGFDTRFVAGISAPAAAAAGERTSPQNQPIQGFVVAFGGWARRCFVYVFRTEAAGDAAVRRIGERLATMVEGSLLAIELTSDLAPTIPREAPPEAPR